VWATTDTTQGIAPRVAATFDADYEVNAISGRGIVRNYNGMAADTLPQAYPYTLFGDNTPVRDPRWNPQVIVIALGTNDFSTALNAGEPWKTRDALHQDYEATYLRFLSRLRTVHPHALILLWATDLANGEIAREAGAVARQAQANGDSRVAFLPVNGLSFSACHAHPSSDDDRIIATAITKVITARADAWDAR
jgi:lysophospholipase L1-like esterase